MKRLTLAILLLTALAAGAFLAFSRPGAEASPDVTITVTRTADTNTRDSFVTLREAMMLATGDLTLANLTLLECGQVSGASWDFPVGPCKATYPPGAASADTIVFDPSLFSPGLGAFIGLGSALPILDTGNDTVDGTSAEVIIDGISEDFPCFYITSDNNTIKGLEIYNCKWGVYLHTGAENNTIGGSSPGEGNVISGNGRNGVSIVDHGTDGNVIKGNLIGTDASGTAALGNGHSGVYIENGENNTIGGTGAGEGNTIAFNQWRGVDLQGGDGNTIRGNSIHSNGEIGIALRETSNDNLARPHITGFGSVMGTACPNCIVDIYSDEEDEGRVYEGATVADGDGDWSFSGSPEGPNVTATATDGDGNTSEFSDPVAVPEATPTPTPTPSPTPSPTPTPGVTPTPPAGPTRTLAWAAGWQNATWSGASTPAEAFACAAGKYAAAYRFTDAGLERYFPDRPDISNMTDLEQYDAFLILITQPVTCVMPVTTASGSSRTLQWVAGWQNEGWSGADGTAPQDAFACADGSYAAAYRFTDAGLERFFPNRPDISNMGPLNKYDAFLILLTAPVTCTMSIAP